MLPQVGFGGASILIVGAGFATGATVSVGDTPTKADMIDNSRIQAVVPSGSGTVDVVVTNPDGQTGRSATGFTYNVVTLTPSATFVAAGTEMNVSWTATHARNSMDWVGLFELDAPNTSYGWWEYAYGTGGVFGLNAPLTRGRDRIPLSSGRPLFRRGSKRPDNGAVGSRHESAPARHRRTYPPAGCLIADRARRAVRRSCRRA